jgi:uncharacterized protein
MRERAVITGASSGIGEAYARAFAAEGKDLVLIARRQEKLLSIAQDLERQYGIKAIYIIADISTQQGLEKVLAVIEQAPIDILVNNAGFGNTGEFEKIPWNKHQKMLEVHVIAPTRLTHAILPSMLSQNKGTIINVSSFTAFVNDGGVYAATKAYLVHFTRSLKTALKGSDVVVQALCPGFTYSDFHKTDEYQRSGSDVYNKIPKFLWMSSEKVVAFSLHALKKRKTIVVPGFFNKIIVFLFKFGFLHMLQTVKSFLKKPSAQQHVR